MKKDKVYCVIFNSYNKNIPELNRYYYADRDLAERIAFNLSCFDTKVVECEIRDRFIDDEEKPDWLDSFMEFLISGILAMVSVISLVALAFTVFKLMGF